MHPFKLLSRLNVYVTRCSDVTFVDRSDVSTPILKRIHYHQHPSSPNLKRILRRLVRKTSVERCHKDTEQRRKEDPTEKFPLQYRLSEPSVSTTEGSPVSCINKGQSYYISFKGTLGEYSDSKGFEPKWIDTVSGWLTRCSGTWWGVTGVLCPVLFDTCTSKLKAYKKKVSNDETPLPWWLTLGFCKVCKSIWIRKVIFPWWEVSINL